VLLVIAGLLSAAIGVTVGAATGTSLSESIASRLAADGYYANAVAVDEAIAQRSGPLYFLDGGASSAAGTAAEATVLEWAAALGRKGQVDTAVTLYRSVKSPPSLQRQAVNAMAALLLKTAAANAAAGHYLTAIQRLDEIATLAPATPPGIEAARALPVDQAGEARLLVAAGRASDAVTLLTTVLAEHSAPATRIATSLFPSALLASGQENLIHDSYKDAFTALNQLVTSYPTTVEASQAEAMLAAPQVVSGTLVTHSGLPVSGRVRLSSNYKSEPGDMYQTSAPFYFTTADSLGDFTFPAVPVGGPYVFEVLSGGNWTTLINPTTNQPVNPVTVTPLVPVDLTFVVLPS
jgi:tetratricopeptide (TPR) repeat protein